LIIVQTGDTGRLETEREGNRLRTGLVVILTIRAVLQNGEVGMSLTI
jgi:hypothetical protein